MISFCKYKSTYKSSILKLLASMWEGMLPEEIQQKFEWRYEKNPYSDNNIYIYLACNGEQVVGFRAFVVQLFKLGEVQYKVFNPADAIVDSNYRRMGIFTQLNNLFLNDIQNISNTIILNTSANQFSSPANLKQGWMPMNYISKFGYQINLRFLLSQTIKLNKNKVKEIETVIKYKNKGHFVLTNKLHLDALIELNDINRNKDIITHIRDKAFYQWRYAYKKQNYCFAYYYKREKLDGYLILKKLPFGQMLVQEYMFKNLTAFKTLINYCYHFFNIYILRVRVFSKSEERQLKKLGFFIEPIKLITTLGRVRLPFLVRPTGKKPTNEDFIIEHQIDLRCSNCWQLNQSAIH